MKKLTVLTLVAALCGCSTYAQKVADTQQAELDLCSNELGLTGLDRADCYLLLEQQRLQQEQANAAAAAVLGQQMMLLNLLNQPQSSPTYGATCYDLGGGITQCR